MIDSVINIAYLVSAILFIFGIKMLGNAETAKKGNFLSALGMFLAIVITLINRQMIESYLLIIIGIVIGSIIGIFSSKKVQMTGMPELVAIFNGFGGLASLLVGWSEFVKIGRFDTFGDYISSVKTSASPHFISLAIIMAIIIGGITFTGSLLAYLRLSGKMSGKPTVFSGQIIINSFVSALIVILSLAFVLSCLKVNYSWVLLFYMVVFLSVLLGVIAVLPIGGGDMPVVISLLNSFSGLAACAAGFVINNTVLIVAGALVGASGLILTFIMCKAMNRSIGNVLFGGFGASGSENSDEVEGEMKALSPEDAYYVLEAASSVVFVPGYGMAVAQAQHVVKELGEILENNGAEVRYAIHPVAGRMPGHMNVLLAESDVPYEQLCEMDDVNAIMPTVDVAIIIGANDVVNPAAANDESSPIYGMPIINAHEAKSVFALKRGKGAGFSGLINKLFFMSNTRMIYGDAKHTLTQIVSQFDNE